MNSMRLLPRDWLLLRKLDHGGCRIDPRLLEAPNYPLIVTSVRSALSTEVLHNESEVVILLVLRMSAATGITLAGFELQASWLESDPLWVEPASRKANNCTFKVGGRTVTVPGALNSVSIHPRTLSRGATLSGVLLGVARGTIPDELSAGELVATLSIRDSLGQNYPYPVSLWYDGIGKELVRATEN